MWFFQNLISGDDKKSPFFCSSALKPDHMTKNKKRETTSEEIAKIDLERAQTSAVVSGSDLLDARHLHSSLDSGFGRDGHGFEVNTIDHKFIHCIDIGRDVRVLDLVFERRSKPLVCCCRHERVLD